MASRETAALERLSARRRDAETKLARLRHAARRELGSWAPRGAVWALPLVAFACGVALALAVGRRRGSGADGAESDGSDGSDTSD